MHMTRQLPHNWVVTALSEDDLFYQVILHKL